MSKPLGMDIGILRDTEGKPKVGIDVRGNGRAVLCMTAKAARIYAVALNTAADEIEKIDRGGEVPS